ncbi:MAG: hypothetical protein JW769_04670 [Parachlamydiales bacterium]|nr:hypothetical protein [Parachlamydiales bacterium]
MIDHYRELLSEIGKLLIYLAKEKIDREEVLEVAQKMVHLSKMLSSDITPISENIAKDIIALVHQPHDQMLLKTIHKRCAYLIENLLEL